MGVKLGVDGNMGGEYGVRREFGVLIALIVGAAIQMTCGWGMLWISGGWRRWSRGSGCACERK